MINACNEAIGSTLLGYAPLTAQLGAVNGVYYGQAPLNAALPYVVYSIAGGGEDNDSPLDSADISYTIKGVAETAQVAGSIADSIRSALHEQTIAIDAPWTVYRCQHGEVFMYVENTERKQYHHAGANYRLRISA